MSYGNSHVWKFPHKETLIGNKRLPRSTMFSMERVPRKSLNVESSNSIQQVIAVLEAVEMLETFLNIVERVRKFHYLQTFAGDVVKADTRKERIVKLWKQCVGNVLSRDTEKVCMKAKHSTHSLDVPGPSNNSTGEPSYYNEHRDTQYMLIW